MNLPVPVPGKFPNESFYLYDRTVFLGNLGDFLAAFRRFYPKTKLALSVKTNYLPLLLLDAAGTDCWFEVVSLAEYRLVRSLDIPAARIIVNGPSKGVDLIALALSEGALIQLDGEEELALLRQLIQTNGESPARVGLRCSLKVPGEPPSRFGFDVSSSSYLDAINFLSQTSSVQMESIHCHYCSASRQPSDYTQLARELIGQAARVPGAGPSILNLGGGFLSPASKNFQEQFPFPWVGFDDYGQAVGEIFSAHYAGREGPVLMLEPGMAVTANCMSFFARVTGIKTVEDRVLIQVAGSCYNIKPNKSKRNLTISLVAGSGGPRRDVEGADIVGYTCMEDDILHRNFNGNIAVGDYVRFDQVGAYSITLKPPFIEPQAPVYIQRPETGVLKLIQAGESWQEMFGVGRTASFP